MIRFLVTCLSSLCVLAAPLQAESTDQPVLVELFASQNCPACPRAHKTMREIRGEFDNALILTWSVSYWDYLGQPDPMALPQAKMRQAAYAENLGLRAPYTPQSIYNGAKECPGTRKRDVRKNIKKLQRQTPAAFQIAYSDDQILLSETVLEAPLQISKVTYLPDGAHDTDMVNPVIEFIALAEWQGEAKTLPVHCDGACAVVVHTPNAGQIKGFTHLK